MRAYNANMGSLKKRTNMSFVILANFNLFTFDLFVNWLNFRFSIVRALNWTFNVPSLSATVIFFWTLLILSWLILVFSSPVILSERLLSPSSSSSSSSSLLPSLWSSSLVKLNQTFFRPFDENHAQFYQKKKNWIVKFSYFMLFKKLNQIFWRPDSLVRESLWS